MSEPLSTPAAYRADLALNPVTNRVEPIDRGGNRAIFALRLVIGIPILGLGTVCLLFGLWPVTIIAFLMALPLLGARRKPRLQRVGVWEGKCPRCGTESYPHAPPLADHYRFTCPGCTRPILLKDQRYEAA